MPNTSVFSRCRLLLQPALLKLQQGWKLLRELSGDDAYERYLQHQTLAHPDEAPLCRHAFFKQQQQQKWHGVKRCC
jgi:uncharacterized short protein YbdD (DUF466 family)